MATIVLNAWRLTSKQFELLDILRSKRCKDKRKTKQIHQKRIQNPQQRVPEKKFAKPCAFRTKGLIPVLQGKMVMKIESESNSLAGREPC